MNQRPPLNALRAFEAAARHLSFTRAAAELNVTPAAVGHQVRALEDHLGVQLFRRLNRSLLLTDAAQACLPDLREGFARLAVAVETIQVRDARGVLTATVAPSFAAKWLVPRLDRFRALHPDITVRIDTAMAEVDLGREGIDIGIRFGAGHYPGLRVERLMGEVLFAVCAPVLCKEPRALRQPADLREHTLLHIDGETADAAWPDWPTWMRAAGCGDVNATVGPRFTQSIMAVQAAIEGQGVVIAPLSVVADDLAAGRLTRPFDCVAGTETGFAWYVVSPEAIAGNPKVAAFRDWIMAETQASSVSP